MKDNKGNSETLKLKRRKGAALVPVTVMVKSETRYWLWLRAQRYKVAQGAYLDLLAERAIEKKKSRSEVEIAEISGPYA